MKDLENRALALNCVNTAFKEKPLIEYEKEFKDKASELKLFELESEYKDFETCFCGK